MGAAGGETGPATANEKPPDAKTTPTKEATASRPLKRWFNRNLPGSFSSVPPAIRCSKLIRHQNSGLCLVFTEALHCRDPGPLLASVQARTDLRTLHRPANLEDVFLKLTGRDLRD